MPKQIAFLHTSPVHVATFDGLLAELAPGMTARHIVDEGLLREARITGLTPALSERIAARLREAGAGADVLLCTCSTIGGSAEELSARIGLPVLRVDRAMAERTVALGARVTIVAALESTLGPTQALIEEEAARTGRPISVSASLCAGAWAAFEAGDQAAYLAQVAACARSAAADADVVVLAQASMAGAADHCADLPVPVLSSPRLGVLAALAAA